LKLSISFIYKLIKKSANHAETLAEKEIQMLTFNQNLEKMKQEPYFNRLFEKLKRDQLSILESLATELAPLSIAEREHKISRLYIDNLTPPKNHRIMIELLANANSKCYHQAKRAMI
jgi:hypothetical protein